MDQHRLTQISGPWLHTVVAAPADLSQQVRDLERKSAKRIKARVVRGRKAATKSALLDECAAALQFPLYFGENWDALSDCLGDLDCLHAEGFVLVIADAAHLLSQETAEDLKQFFHILEQSAANWRQERGKSKGRPYQVVLHAVPGEEAALHSRCQAAGVHPVALA
jgi:hypothetical protein